MEVLGVPWLGWYPSDSGQIGESQADGGARHGSVLALYLARTPPVFPLCPPAVPLLSPVFLAWPASYPPVGLISQCNLANLSPFSRACKRFCVSWQ